MNQRNECLITTHRKVFLKQWYSCRGTKPFPRWLVGSSVTQNIYMSNISPLILYFKSTVSFGESLISDRPAVKAFCVTTFYRIRQFTFITWISQTLIAAINKYDASYFGTEC